MVDQKRTTGKANIEDIAKTIAKSSLSFRRSSKGDESYIKNLAYREIGRVPRRLAQHTTYMIYEHKKPIGFISYAREGSSNLYIYMLALEKEAQNQGHARIVVRWVLAKEMAESSVEGIYFRVYKTNQQALHTSLDKYNYKIVEELPQHYVLFKNYTKES